MKVGGKNFKNKTTLTNYCKFILNNADNKSILEGDWLDVMKDVVVMHERFEEKTKNLDYTVGVRTCSVNPRNRQFYILRSDGTDTDFSYYKAIGSSSKVGRIKTALRESVREQMIDFKDAYFKENEDSKGYVVCSETNLKMKRKDSHMDHYPKQFDEILQEWVTDNNVNSDELEIYPAGDNTNAWIFKDQSLLESFVNFHESVAEYRMVLNKVNLQRKRSKKFDF